MVSRRVTLGCVRESGTYGAGRRSGLQAVPRYGGPVESDPDRELSVGPAALALLFGEKPQMIAQVSHALNMVYRLPDVIYGDDLNAVAQMACLEDFFLNVRLMVEFLVRRPSAKDFSAVDLKPCWQAEAVDPEILRRLNDYWEVASQHVSHLSRERLQDPVAPKHVDVSPEGLRRIRDHVCTVYEAWVSA